MSQKDCLFLDKNIEKFSVAKQKIDALLEGDRSPEEQLHLITNCVIILIALIRSRKGDDFTACFMKVGMQVIKCGEPLLVKRNYMTKEDVL
jgi:hypothetical protein